MARSRRSNLDRVTERHIVKEARDGVPAASIIAETLARRPNANQNQIRAAIRTGQAEAKATTALDRRTQRTRGTIQQLAGCPPGANVRISMRMRWNDAHTGDPRKFEVDVDARGGEVEKRQHLARAAREILDYARSFGSITRSLGEATIRQGITFEVITVRCL